MNKCLICMDNEADKTGSHIIPHFLMKRIDNAEGEKGRDKELGFVIDLTETKSYFGRGILPEKLEDVYGEVDDKLLEENKNDGILDNIFCTECEKKLAQVENEYSKTLKTFSDSNRNYESNKSPFLGFIFWVSIVWRLSIMPNSGFLLKDKEEKRLNRILKKYLNLDINKIKMDINDCDLNDIGYKLLRSPNFSDIFPTFQYSHPYFGMPYFMMIDEFILFFYFKKNYTKGMLFDFFETSKFEKNAEFNTAFETEKINSLEHLEFKATISSMLAFWAKKKFERLDKKLDKFHRMTFPKHGKQMDLRLKALIHKNIAESDVKLGKNNIGNEVKIAFDTIVKFYHIKD